MALTGYNASGDLGVPPTFYIQRSEQSEHPVAILLHLCYGYLPQSTSCALLYPVPTNVPLGGGYDSVEPGWFTISLRLFFTGRPERGAAARRFWPDALAVDRAVLDAFLAIERRWTFCAGLAQPAEAPRRMAERTLLDLSHLKASHQRHSTGTLLSPATVPTAVGT